MRELGKFLERQRAQAALWTKIFFGLLALFVVVNVFLRPADPHFHYDEYLGFWPVFGLGVGVVMIFVMKRLIQPLIVRKEDYYGDC